MNNLDIPVYFIIHNTCVKIPMKTLKYFPSYFQVSPSEVRIPQSTKEGGFQTRRLQHSTRQCLETKKKIPARSIHHLSGRSMAMDSTRVRHEFHAFVVGFRHFVVADCVRSWRYEFCEFGWQFQALHRWSWWIRFWLLIQYWNATHNRLWC